MGRAAAVEQRQGGLLGISYYAINKSHVASLRLPHLAAMCRGRGPRTGIATWRGMAASYARFGTKWMLKQVITVEHGRGDRSSVNPNTGQRVAGPETVPEE